MEPSRETLPVSPDSEPIQQKAATVRTFLFAVASDKGPRLLAFRTSNVLVGRLPDNHLSLNHGSVSRRHAKISVTNQGVFIEDMGSQNGTTLNGTSLKGQSNLRPGDILRIGHVPLYYFGFVNPDRPPQLELVDASIAVNPLLPNLS